MSFLFVFFPLHHLFSRPTHDGVEAPERRRRRRESIKNGGRQPAWLAVFDIAGLIPFSAPAAPKQEEEEEEEERPTEEVEEKKSEDPRRAPADEEEKSTAAGAMCKKGDGKGWRCKRVAQSGYSLCQYHLDKLRSYYSYSQTKKKQKKKPKAASATEKSTAARVLDSQGASQQKKNNKRRRVEEDVLGTGLGISDSFYYYSGFGPRWGKRRGESRSVEGGVRLPDGGASQVELRRGEGDAAAAAAVAVGGGEEDEYDCDASSRDGKPLKSRALSSLL